MTDRTRMLALGGGALALLAVLLLVLTPGLIGREPARGPEPTDVATEVTTAPEDETEPHSPEPDDKADDDPDSMDSEGDGEGEGDADGDADGAGDSVQPPEGAPAVDAPPDPTTAATLTGEAEITDPAGDVTDTAGTPPPGGGAEVDLVAVRLEGDGEVLAITWEVAGEVPVAADFLLWSLDLWSDDELAVTISIQQDGARRVGGVLDWSTSAQVVLLEQPEVDGATVRLVVPLGALPRLEGPITWQALGQLDGGYEDLAPAEDRAPFPS